MSQTISANLTTTPAPTASPWAQSIRCGLAALAVGAAAAVFGAYGDPHPKASQEHAVPFICGVLAVVAVCLFAGLVPPALRGVAERAGRWSGWALALGILAVLFTPVAFWSGLPVVVGTAGAVIGVAARRASGRGLATAAVVVSTFAVVASLAMNILGNTLLSS